MKQIQRVRVGTLITNCYILTAEKTAAVIDPGGSPQKILAACAGKPIRQIFLTHAHLDHTEAINAIRGGDTQVYLHPDDLPFLNDDTLRAPFDGPDSHPDLKFAAPLPIGENDILEWEGGTLQVLHTPGHTPGSVCFYDKEEGVLFSGDTLFLATCGRTDLPGGNPEKMKASLRRLLRELPPETKVFSGHGFATTIGAERGRNET